MRSLSILVLILIATPGWVFAEADGENPAVSDSLEIVEVLPRGALTRGVQVELTIDVEVTLESMDRAEIMLGFNTEESNTSRMVANRTVSRGTTTLTFEVRVIPVDWQNQGEFYVLVNMGPEMDGVQRGYWTPTSSIRRVLEVGP